MDNNDDGQQRQRQWTRDHDDNKEKGKHNNQTVHLREGGRRMTAAHLEDG
jgi:hypothetical protein